MRTQIKVTDLSLKQWDWLQTKLDREHQIPVGAARVCVEFELVPEFSPIHVEMPARKLARVLDMLEHSSLMEAALAPDALPDEPVTESAGCGHHNPPHLYDCRATPEQVTEKLTGDKPSWTDEDEGNTSIPASYDREPEGRY